MTIPIEKKCSRCREIKNASEFYLIKRNDIKALDVYCKSCKKDIKQERKEKDRKKNNEYAAWQREQYRKLVYAAYGDKCSCCDETELKFLTIDHVNNDGAEHRRSLGTRRAGNTWQVYRYIINNNYPDDFQILCYNCNCGRNRNQGVCPHKLGG